MEHTDLTDVSTHEARALSVALFRELAALEEGTEEYSRTRNTLVELNLSLVRYAARRFRNRSEPMEDIVQVGTIGLIKAINRFDPARGVEFTSFAMPTITGEIKRFFRDTSWAVKVPAGSRNCGSTPPRRTTPWNRDSAASPPTPNCPSGCTSRPRNSRRAGRRPAPTRRARWTPRRNRRRRASATRTRRGPRSARRSRLRPDRVHGIAGADAGRAARP